MLTKQSSKGQHSRGPLQGYRTTVVLFPYLQPFNWEGSAIRRCAEQRCEFEPCGTSPVSSNAFDDLNLKNAQILIKAIGKIIWLWVGQFFTIIVITSYWCWKRLVSFQPSPEWDVITITAMHIKIPLSHLQNAMHQTLEIKLIKIKPMLMTKYVRSIYGMSDSCVAGM
jgi:hypothetical protein